MRKKVKGFLIAAFAAAMLFGATLTSEAAPKTMPDGQIFDAQFYAQSYPDVAAVLGNDESMLYFHYVNMGKVEGRLPYAGAQGAANAQRAGMVDVKIHWESRVEELGNGNQLVKPLTYSYPANVYVEITDADVIEAAKRMLPDGAEWGLEAFYDKISTVTNKKDMNVRAQGCLAFAYWLTDAIYGDTPMIAYNGAGAGFEFCMYDIVVFNTPYTAVTGQYHAGVVIGADPATQTLYLVEANVLINGNPQGVVRWNSPLKVDGSDGNTIGMVLRRVGVTP
ncbi:MAG: hypothetical protein K2K21_06535 [Lachnospiraceae bacterium]|nr:hypothetical protein [Lachnospiraceae bacterium]